MKAYAVPLFASLACAPLAAWAAAAAPAILSPANGAVVTSPVTITISPGTAATAPMDMSGMSGMSDMPGMSHMAHGHLHLIIDAPLPVAGASIPMDKRHIHLTHGETSKTVSLPPGQHTIILIAGSAGHTVPPNAAHSDPVTFTVK